MSIKILGTGRYIPEKIITNDDLSEMVETSDEWIMQRVGIKQRHVSTDETTAMLAFYAAKDALYDAQISPTEIDLIIAASITSDTICPTVAGFVQRKLNASCPAFDINSACSGFLFALDCAVSYFSRENINKILVIGAERLSKIVDWKDRSTCVIFGDGAGAFIIEKGDGYLASKIQTQGGNEVIEIPAFGGTSPFFERDLKAPFIFMDGQETFKFAVSRIVEDIKEVSKKAGISPEQIDYIVPHQANIRIIDFAAKRLGIPREKFVVNIDKYGNTSSASIPIAFDELAKSGKLKMGDIVAMCAFGGGLSNAACIIKY